MSVPDRAFEKKKNRPDTLGCSRFHTFVVYIHTDKRTDGHTHTHTEGRTTDLQREFFPLSITKYSRFLLKKREYKNVNASQLVFAI